MLKLGLLLLIVPVLALLTGYVAELSDVQQCLEMNGSYDYVLHSCDLQTEHPYIPYLQRYPDWVNMAFLVAFAGIVLCFVGLYKGRR